MGCPSVDFCTCMDCGDAVAGKRRAGDLRLGAVVVQWWMSLVVLL
jgi:hypothetical protein